MFQVNLKVNNDKRKKKLENTHLSVGRSFTPRYTNGLLADHCAMHVLNCILGAASIIQKDKLENELVP
jgi:hypothetical protein